MTNDNTLANYFSAARNEPLALTREEMRGILERGAAGSSKHFIGGSAIMWTSMLAAVLGSLAIIFHYWIQPSASPLAAHGDPPSTVSGIVIDSNRQNMLSQKEQSPKSARKSSTPSVGGTISPPRGDMKSPAYWDSLVDYMRAVKNRPENLVPDSSTYFSIVPFVRDTACAREMASHIHSTWVSDSIYADALFRCFGDHRPGPVETDTSTMSHVPFGKVGQSPGTASLNDSNHPFEFDAPYNDTQTVEYSFKAPQYDLQRKEFLNDHRTTKIDVRGIRFLELTPQELAPLGIIRTNAGVWERKTWFANHLDQGQLSFYDISDNFQFANKCAYSARATHWFDPVMRTDDLGNIRSIQFVARRVDSVLAMQIHALPVNSGKRYLLEQQLKAEAQVAALKRVNTLVPIAIRLPRRYAETDARLHRWHPVFVYWFEPTPEFLALLPDRIRKGLQHELATAECITDKIAAGSSITGCDSTGGTTAKAKAQSVYFDLQRSFSGVIVKSSVYPNPAIGSATVNYTLSANRTVRFTLHDITGHLLRTVAPEQTVPAGEHTASIDLRGVTQGIYLLTLTTNQEERAVQRIIVKGK